MFDEKKKMLEIVANASVSYLYRPSLCSTLLQADIAPCHSSLLTAPSTKGNSPSEPPSDPRNGSDLAAFRINGKDEFCARESSGESISINGPGMGNGVG